MRVQSSKQDMLQNGSLKIETHIKTTYAPCKPRLKRKHAKLKVLRFCRLSKESTHHSLYIPGVDSEALIAAVNQKIAISTGSACTSHSVQPSHVLLAMDPDIEKAESTIRVSYGWQNTIDEVNEAAEVIATAVREIRSFFQ